MNDIMEDWMNDLIGESQNEKLIRVLDEHCMSEEDALNLLKDITGVRYKSFNNVPEDELRLLLNALGGNI